MKSKYIEYNEDDKTVITEDLIVNSFYTTKRVIASGDSISVHPRDFFELIIIHGSPNKEYRGVFNFCRMGGGLIIRITKVTEFSFGGVGINITNDTGDRLKFDLTGASGDITLILKKIN